MNPNFALAKLLLGQAKSARRAACLDKVETCGVHPCGKPQPKANFAFFFLWATDRRAQNCNAKFGMKKAMSAPHQLASLAMTVICVCFFTGCQAHAKENKACFKKTCYVVELAISDEEKMRGLQKREHLDKNKGMLFALSGNGPQKFWMKDTLIPLDMLWLDYTGQIIYIEHDAVTCEKDPCPVYGPDVPAAYVLEVNAGEAGRHGMHIGDRIDIRIPK